MCFSSQEANFWEMVSGRVMGLGERGIGEKQEMHGNQKVSFLEFDSNEQELTSTRAFL